MNNKNSNSSEDIVDSVGIDPLAKKENVLERLNKRNKDRQNYLDSKNEQRQKIGLDLEGADYFSESFNEKVHEINLRIQNVSDTAAKKNIGDVNPDLRRIFADITMEIQELERYLTKSTMFLTDYKIKTCQNILNDLLSSNEEARQKLMPKKKFGFSGKKSKSSLMVETTTVKTEKSDQGNVLKSADILNQGSEKHQLKNEDATDFNKSKDLISSYYDNGATLHNRHDEYICLKGPEIDNKDITISSLENCFIDIQGHLGSLQLHNINNCVILCGPVARACFVQYCENSTLVVACQQLRLHTSSSVHLYLHVTCRAVIEESKKIQISPYNYDYPGLESDFACSGLDRNINKYQDIADFDWLSPDIPSPNWELVDDHDLSLINFTWEEMRCKFEEKVALSSPK